jgi:1-acyl-sn-glycerol-3-phosphate acyltransferase
VTAISPGTVRPEKSEKTPIFRLLSIIVIPFMAVLAKITVTGVEHVPKTGAFILAPNHYSEIDPLVVGVAMWKADRMPRFLAKASLWKVPVLSWLLRHSGQVPVERQGSGRGTDPIAAAEKIAREGLAVIFYPEGTLTRDPDYWPMRGKSGAVRMALHAGIPIIPFAHWGTQLVLPRYGKLSVFPRKRITAKFGPAVDLAAFRDRAVTPVLLTEATTLVMDDITKLLEGLRGENAPIERWDPAEHHQPETGNL